MGQSSVKLLLQEAASAHEEELRGLALESADHDLPAYTMNTNGRDISTVWICGGKVS